MNNILSTNPTTPISSSLVSGYFDKESNSEFVLEVVVVGMGGDGWRWGGGSAAEAQLTVRDTDSLS